VRKADNLPPSCAVVKKSGRLNFLEPSGPVLACNGTAYFFTVINTFVRNVKGSYFLETILCVLFNGLHRNSLLSPCVTYSDAVQ